MWSKLLVGLNQFLNYNLLAKTLKSNSCAHKWETKVNFGAAHAVTPCIFIGPLNNGQYYYCSELYPCQQLDTDFESVEFSPAVELYVVTNCF